MSKLESQSFCPLRESKTYLRIAIITLTAFMVSCSQGDEVIDEVVEEKDYTKEILLAGDEEKTWGLVSSKKKWGRVAPILCERR